MRHLVVGGLRCIDWEGGFVEEGAVYVPTKDSPCRKCTCDYGIPANCFVKTCEAPRCEVFERIEGKCCEVRCIRAPSGGALLVDGAGVTPDPRRGKGRG